MKDKWLNDLNNRMSEFEMDAPENLWNQIEAAETGKRYRQNFILRKRIQLLAITACVATILILMVINLMPSLQEYSVPEKKNTILSDNMGNSPVRQTGNGINMSLDPAPTIPTVSNYISQLSNSHISQSSITDTVATKDCHELLEPISHDNQFTQDEIEQIEKDNHDTIPESENWEDKAIMPTQYDGWKRFAKTTSGKKADKSFIGKTDNHTSINIFSSGGLNSHSRNMSVGETIVSSVGPDASNWKDSPMLAYLLYNQGKEIKTDIKHRQPVRAGISFSYRFDNRWSLSSGITYTNLTSDITNGSSSHYFNGKQSLHYIGIPLGVSFNLLTWKRLQLYVAGGVLAEKCISGKTKIEYTLDNQQCEPSSETISSKPFQFSVNASPGVQFNISSIVGLYAEPGISYYFDDGSDLRTIYKEKPLNFNLNFGLRFSL